MKVETASARQIGAPAHEAGMLVLPGYRAQTVYLSKSGARYEWNPARIAALTFATWREAADEVEAYRTDFADRRARLKIVADWRERRG